MIAEDLDMFTKVVDDDLNNAPTPPAKSPTNLAKANASVKTTSPDPISGKSRSKKGSQASKNDKVSGIKSPGTASMDNAEFKTYMAPTIGTLNRLYNTKQNVIENQADFDINKTFRKKDTKDSSLSPRKSKMRHNQSVANIPAADRSKLNASNVLSKDRKSMVNARAKEA